MEDKTISVVPEQIESLAIRQGTAMAVDRAPDEVLAEAQKAAKALRDVVSQKKKKVMFNGEQYLEFEDLQTLGHFYGVTAGEDGDPEPVVIGDVTGFKASSVAYRHGQVISRATQYCMSDEPNWARKPLFQLSSMAQTRANAKVLRNVLAWVVVLAGYKPTPAEEMDGMSHTQTLKKNNGDNGLIATEIKEYVDLVSQIIKADANATPDKITQHYFTSKSGKTPGYAELLTWQSAKQIQWVHGVCKKLREDFSTVLAPVESDSKVSPDVTDDDIPF